MFQKENTCRTDVWSLGVTLFVLFAEYSVDILEKVFNSLQSSDSDDKRIDELRALPNMPADMPDSFLAML